MPTLTLDEFAEREMARMEEATEKQKQYQENKSDSDSENEEVSDKKTYKAREWDDWKDLNDKGSGNRMGK
jgi:immunoglobulin-binding protein 1